MKLYGAALSPFAARCLLAIRWKGLDIPLVPPPGGGLKSPEYLAINPYGKVPALDADGGIVIESEVIVEFLEDRFPETPLLPADPLARAHSRAISRAIDLYVMAPMTTLFGQLNPATRDRALVDVKLAEMRRGLDGLEMLVRAPYAAGESRSLADCALVPLVFYIEGLMPAFGQTAMLASYPKVAAVAAKTKEDPIVQQLMQEMAASLEAFRQRRG
ncbi:MAG TPA: glutathione S-transferase family protein [Azospirillaceae bacterium]|nr:glutathione S-transferase family protein [Azospirillaceae bacterium]